MKQNKILQNQIFHFLLLATVSCLPQSFDQGCRDRAEAQSRPFLMEPERELFLKFS